MECFVDDAVCCSVVLHLCDEFIDDVVQLFFGVLAGPYVVEIFGCDVAAWAY